MCVLLLAYYKCYSEPARGDLLPCDVRAKSQRRRLQMRDDENVENDDGGVGGVGGCIGDKGPLRTNCRTPLDCIGAFALVVCSPIKKKLVLEKRSVRRKR